MYTVRNLCTLEHKLASERGVRNFTEHETEILHFRYENLLPEIEVKEKNKLYL